jgi:hypothetical protein
LTLHKNSSKIGVDMNIFNLPCFGFNGKNYAFNRWLESHTVSKAGLNTEKWSFDTTDTEIINSWRN